MIKLCAFTMGLLFFSYQRMANHDSNNSPASPPYQLAFANFGPLNTDIFISDVDGSNARPLAPSPGLDYNASFSRNGEWVLFTSDRNGSADIYRVHTDGSRLEQLTNDPSFDDQAAFSPDGKKIAFVSSRAGETDIFILEIATKKTTNVTKHPGGDFRPSWSPDGKYLAFSSDRDSKKPIPERDFRTLHSTEIYTVRDDGTELTKRTNNDAFAGSPCWSADGKKLLVYETNLEGVRKMTSVSPTLKAGATSQIAIIDLADNSMQMITKAPGEKISPRWMADGSIAYVNSVDSGGIVFINGNRVVRGEFNSPSWSTDGSRMIFHRELNFERPPLNKLYSRDKQFQLIRSGVFPSFSSAQGNPLICNDKTAAFHHNQIMQMNADGTNRFILFGDSIKSCVAPVWSPGGDKIAFGFGRFFQNIQGPAMADIAIINKDGTQLKILTDGKSNCGFPSWSPDGKKIVYRKSTDSTKGLFIVEVETGKIITLTTNTHDNFPCWSPTGDLISFTSKRSGNYDIYTIKPDGTSLKRLTTDPGNDAQSAWSPDGKWIAFSTASTGFKDECPLYPANPQSYGEICVMRYDGSDKRILTDNQFEDGTIGWVPISP